MFMCVPVSIFVYLYPITSGQRSDGFFSKAIKASAGGDCHHHQLHHITMYVYIYIYVYVYVYVCPCSHICICISYNEWTKERRVLF